MVRQLRFVQIPPTTGLPMHRLISSIMLAFIATFAIDACASERKPIRSDKHAFEVVTLVQGLEHPWSIAWLPDGRMLVTERAGRLRIVSKDFQLDPKPVEGLPRIVVGG